MKKSELKSLIKEEITSSYKLQENSNEELFNELRNVCKRFQTKLDPEDINKALLKLSNIYGEEEYLSEDKPGYGVGDFSDDNPIIKGINKGIDVVGKGFKKFDKAMRPLGKAAASAMRNE